MSIQTLEPRLADVGGIPIARLLPNKGLSNLLSIGITVTSALVK